jgi:SlyX protein
MEDRIINLETKIAYLEHSVADLSDVLAAQNGNIAALEKKLDVLISMFRRMNEDAESGDMPHEKPPHY